MNAYPNLVSPFTVKGVTYKNRMFAAPMGRCLIDNGVPMPQPFIDAFRRKAEGGWAEVAIGETSVDSVYGSRFPEGPVDYSDFVGLGFRNVRRCAEAIRMGGAVPAIELCHCGAEMAYTEGRDAIGPRGFTRDDGLKVIGMDEAMMDAVCGQFADAALFMRRAGFQAVIPHFGHGWLLHQFLSPRTNPRTDRYGGSLENRARFPIAVLERIREKCGRGLVIEVRVSGTEMTEGGIPPAETAEFCRMLRGLADLIHVSSGLYHNPVLTNQFSPLYAAHGCNLPYAQLIRRVSGIPTVVVGGLSDPGFCENIVASGKADFVAFGRQTFADHDFAVKVSEGRGDDVAQCFRCFKCMRGDMEKTTLEGGTPAPQRCTVNPAHNMVPPPETLSKPEAPRRVLVVGGGVAGMAAAAAASERGHRVTLLEASGSLGGLLRFAEHDAYKSDMWEFPALLSRRMDKGGVQIRLNTPATPERVAELRPEALILALGSRPAVPPIPGIALARHCLDMYFDIDSVGERVVVCGGGLVGCEAAVHLKKLGRDVTVLEMADALLPDAYPMHRVALLDLLSRSASVHTGARCAEIRPDGVLALMDGVERFFPADMVLYALGMRPNGEQLGALRAGAPEGAQVFEIGDCVKPAKIFEAAEQGYLAAYAIL